MPIDIHSEANYVDCTQLYILIGGRKALKTQYGCAQELLGNDHGGGCFPLKRRRLVRPLARRALSDSHDLEKPWHKATSSYSELNRTPSLTSFTPWRFWKRTSPLKALTVASFEKGISTRVSPAIFVATMAESSSWTLTTSSAGMLHWPCTSVGTLQLPKIIVSECTEPAVL